MSIVAAIIDKRGGMRVVVEDDVPALLLHMTIDDERCYVVPDFHVVDPVPFDQIPSVIKRAQDYVASQNGTNIFN